MANIAGNSGNNALTGTNESDNVSGLDGNDTLNGGAGNDTLYGDGGADRLDGGNGIDTVSYATASSGVVVNLAKGTSTAGEAAGDVLISIENLTGSSFADTLIGNTGANLLIGGAGDDLLVGGGGGDTAVYSGNVRDYVATKVGADWTIHALTISEGTDTLKEMEWVQFADVLLRLDANNAPLLPEDSATTTNEDSGILAIDLLQGAWDFEGDTLSATDLHQTAGPAATLLLKDGVLNLDTSQFGWLAASQSTALTFAYGVSDGSATTTRTVSVTVEGRNDAPVAVADSFSTAFGTPLVLAQSLLLGNDSDPDTNDTLSLQSVGNASHGTVGLDAQGRVIFTPTLGFSGNATFNYTISDGHAGSAAGTAMVNVGAPPPSTVVVGVPTSLGVLPQTRVAGGVGWDMVSVAVLADSSSVVTWSSTSVMLGTPGSDVIARRYDAQGNPIGNAFTVNTTTAYEQGRTSVTALADGGVLVAWEGRLANQGPMDVFQQRYDANGVKVGSENRVNTYTSGDQYRTKVASLADGGWVVTWASTDQGDVYQQRYSASGQAVGGETRINSFTPNGQSWTQVTGLADGGWAVVWETINGNQDGSGRGVYMQRFGKDGAMVGPETQVNSFTTGDQGDSAIASLVDGGWVVTWHSTGQDGSGIGVYGQIFNADGTRRGGEQQMAQSVAGDQFRPAVVGLADGGFMVSWSGAASGGYGLYGRRFKADGAPVGGEFLISQSITGGTDFPDLASRPDGGFVAAWERPDDVTSTSGDWEVSTRIFKGNATSLGIYTGTAGNDVLFGSSGNDTMTGGGGADAFLITAPGQGFDVITDFQPGVDRIELVGANFGGLAVGQLDASRFALNAPADSDDRLVFNTTTGALSYDPDGNGSSAASIIAVLNVHTLSASDLWLVSGA